uniref:Uncharacterized protein n=1 Tax=Macrostomum lignano TaxID=282301 RepID=A0A1I8F856_9PLAT
MDSTIRLTILTQSSR